MQIPVVIVGDISRSDCDSRVSIEVLSHRIYSEALDVLRSEACSAAAPVIRGDAWSVRSKGLSPDLSIWIQAHTDIRLREVRIVVTGALRRSSETPQRVRRAVQQVRTLADIIANRLIALPSLSAIEVIRIRPPQPVANLRWLPDLRASR